MFAKGESFGKYQILDVLGSGGFGTVYLAEDSMIQKRMALKVPHEQTRELEKLLAEARLLARLDHPHIVRVYTADIVNETFFIVMEYVEGETLMDRLKNGKKLPVEDAVDLLIPIGEAAEYAHRKNILHRDIRPSNILVEAASGVPKVADFGTSRLLDAVPFAKTRIGSPPYMPPEQFDGRATYASDVYALGVMAYRIMSGKLPFFSGEVRELEQMIKREAPVPLHLQERSVPKRVSDIVMRAMEKDVKQRTPSAAALVADLHDAVEKSYRTPEIEEIRTRILEREKPRSGTCWNCKKPIPARARACPHCQSEQ
ncbi:MAG: protein kinase [Acidobacteriota bacterium]|nr:MAG: protein kinase [Acidobacteriota bacterium]